MSSEHRLIFLKPIFHEKIWGGRKLADEWGYDIPDGPIGECWAISAHPHGDCEVARGEFAGHHLSELWAGERDLFGEVPADNGPTDQFPLLIKILDAQGDLSVQVHPDDDYAREHENGSLGKKECWYVLGCDPGATIVVGQRAHDRKEFAAMVEAGEWSELLNEVPIHPGDFFQIDPGTVHAIKAGTTILETQQSSDVTYRVYDYDRLQADGTKRPLHIAQSLDTVDFSVTSPKSGTVTASQKDGVTELVSCDRYVVDRVRVGDGGDAGDAAPQAVTLPSIPTFLCASVIAGAGTAAGEPVEKGDHFVVPANFGELELAGDMTLIVSHVPVA